MGLTKDNMECWNYGKKGHMKKKCWLQKKKEGEGQQENLQETNVVSSMVHDALILSLDNITDSYLIYTKASFSFHATPHRIYFQDYVQCDFGYGDDEAFNFICPR